MNWTSILQKFLTNPMGIFIYGILSKWAVIMSVAVLVVTFWVFKGLKEAGVLDAAQAVVVQALTESKSVAKYCIPKINQPAELWSCLSDPPEYQPDEFELNFLKSLTKDIQAKQPTATDNNIANPYE